MDYDALQQVVVVVVGAVFTLLVWGALGWWIVYEWRRPEPPHAAQTPDAKPVGEEGASPR